MPASRWIQGSSAIEVCANSANTDSHSEPTAAERCTWKSRTTIGTSLSTGRHAATSAGGAGISTPTAPSTACHQLLGRVAMMPRS